GPAHSTRTARRRDRYALAPPASSPWRGDPTRAHNEVPSPLPSDLVVYRHIVPLRFHDEATAEQRSAAREALEDLGRAEHPGLVRWTVVESLDDRKGTVLVEDATFASRAHFETFRRSEAHRRVAHQLAELADWLVGDYHEE